MAIMFRREKYREGIEKFNITEKKNTRGKATPPINLELSNTELPKSYLIKIIKVDSKI